MRYHVLPCVLPSARMPVVNRTGTSGETAGSNDCNNGVGGVSDEGSGCGNSSVAGEQAVTLQGGIVVLARYERVGMETTTILVVGKRNAARVVHADITLGQPVVHLVNNVLLLDAFGVSPLPPLAQPSPLQPSSPPPVPPSPPPPPPSPPRPPGPPSPPPSPPRPGPLLAPSPWPPGLPPSSPSPLRTPPTALPTPVPRPLGRPGLPPSPAPRTPPTPQVPRPSKPPRPLPRAPRKPPLAAPQLPPPWPPSPSPPSPSPPPGLPARPSPPVPPPPRRINGSTVFNLTWQRDMDVDLVVVAELPTGGNWSMFYSNIGPDPEIGGGFMVAAAGNGLVSPSPFYSRVAGSWEALVWAWPMRPVQAVYTICSFFYNLEWAPGTVVDAARPLVPLLTVSTGDGSVLVGTAIRPLAQPGAFTFTLVPRNCSSQCAWYLAQVCVDAEQNVWMVTAPATC